MTEQIQETLSVANPKKLKEIEAKYNKMSSGGGKTTPIGFSPNMRLMQIALIKHYLPGMQPITKQRAEKTLAMLKR